MYVSYETDRKAHEERNKKKREKNQMIVSFAYNRSHIMYVDVEC